GAVVVLVVLANDHLIMITAHFPLFFLKIRHFFYRYQLVDPKDPTYKGRLISCSIIFLRQRKHSLSLCSGVPGAVNMMVLLRQSGRNYTG
ncbi:MAG: hypothetical protein ACRC5A_03585, partial [Enterobacteriaceae bacterium]